MDGHRFDDLTRALASGSSRRRVLKGLVGGAAGGALSLVGLRRAGASHGRPAGATCIRNEHCASGVCDPQTRRCAGCVPFNQRCDPAENACCQEQGGPTICSPIAVGCSLGFTFCAQGHGGACDGDCDCVCEPGNCLCCSAGTCQPCS